MVWLASPRKIKVPFQVKLNFTHTDNPPNHRETTRIRFPNGQLFSCAIKSDGGNSRDTNPQEDLVTVGKTLAISPRCQHYRMASEYWSYELCTGKKASQFRIDESTISAALAPKTLIGNYVEGSRRVLRNGTIEELYSGGNGNRSATVHYVCGRSIQTFIEITEPETHQYRFTLGHPAACLTYTMDDGNRVYDDFEEEEEPFEKLSDVPEAQSGSITEDRLISVDYRRKVGGYYSGSWKASSACTNFTIGYWSYQYCYPHVLWQFHISPTTGAMEGRPHLLGTITNGSRESLEEDEESFATRVPKFTISSTALSSSEGGHGRRWPLAVRHEIMYTLGNGSICHENNETRSVLVKLSCPEDWEDWHPGDKPRVDSLVEVALCRYTLSVSVPALCADTKMLPRRRDSGKDEISCSLVDEEDPSRADVPRLDIA
ncbi:hypothetical protein FOL47_003364 [Perkinsus chesapeaki]|uniref:MRH domain-containing protein n=1 Tax=Perkinsus chesapeaki TaxID=330153 RepID=A0A7J6M8G9_PERCH|nr:hypothetical protein FOL47_003364 [Perkinsus chesapeaki]